MHSNNFHHPLGLKSYPKKSPAMRPSPSAPLLPLLLLSATLTAAKFLCHSQDAEALLAIRTGFGDPPHLSSWNASTDCCRDWAGVWCDADAGGRVTALNLQHAGLSGAIPPSVARLSLLRGLILVANPGLAGTIPPSIAQLRHLSHLRITDNPLLAGPIPQSLCRLPRLEGVFLYLNNLTGPIPGCFGGNVSYIDFSGNRLSGPIPDTFMRGSTAPSVTVDLHRNSLSGPIPASMGAAAVDSIDVSENQLTDARALFGEEKRTRALRASHNRLEFDISEVGFPMRLRELAVDHNRLRGRIPPQVGRMESLAYFDVSYNRLCGAIPSGRYLELMNPRMFQHNQCLCGGPLRPCRR